MHLKALMGITIPLIGTSLGAACVFFIRRETNARFARNLCAFAAGVMLAASVWSLILPSLEMSENLKHFSFVPATAGILAGFVFLIGIEKHTSVLDVTHNSMLVFSVNLHNLPEGMAVGVVYAAWLAGISEITYLSCLAISIGIAAQNLPEGAIISMPLHSAGVSRKRAFCKGILSGIIEPFGALITILFYPIIAGALPFLLGLAAGAMLYVVYKEMVPQANKDNTDSLSVMMFVVGFCLMMVLDNVFS